MYRVRTAYYRLVGRLTNVEVLEHFTGFGLYDRSLVEHIRTHFRDPYPYLRGMIAELGLPIAKVFYNQKRRERGLTKNNFYSLYDFAMLGITNLSKVPLRLVIFFGFFSALLSFVMGMFYLVYKLVFWNSFTVGVAPVVLGPLFSRVSAVGRAGHYVKKRSSSPASLDIVHLCRSFFSAYPAMLRNRPVSTRIGAAQGRAYDQKATSGLCTAILRHGF